jgi:ABC-type proline/glycine betaine transport system permease subunit
VTAWITLLGWGIFRNSLFPVLYAFLIYSFPDPASSDIGLMIGIALGIAATTSTSVAGIVIDNFGFTKTTSSSPYRA